MSSRVFGLLAALAVMFAATTIQAGTLIPLVNDDLSLDSNGNPVVSGGEPLGAGQHPYNWYIDFPSLAIARAASTTERTARTTTSTLGPAPMAALRCRHEGYPNTVFTNYYCNVPPSAGGVAGVQDFAGGVQEGHTYQLTAAVRESLLDDNDLAHNSSVAPGPTFQAFLVDTDPNWATDGNPNGQEYTVVAGGPNGVYNRLDRYQQRCADRTRHQRGATR